MGEGASQSVLDRVIEAQGDIRALEARAGGVEEGQRRIEGKLDDHIRQSNSRAEQNSGDIRELTSAVTRMIKAQEVREQAAVTARANAKEARGFVKWLIWAGVIGGGGAAGFVGSKMGHSEKPEPAPKENAASPVDRP